MLQSVQSVQSFFMNHSLVDRLVEEKKTNAWLHFQYMVHMLQMKCGVKRKKCFVSYAWEDDAKTRKALQEQLRVLSGDLAKMGTDLILDLEDLQGEIHEWMKDRIAESDYVFVIGTPTYEKKCLNPSSNVALEWKWIQEKVKSAKEQGNTNVLFPLLYEGDFLSSFPPTVVQHLIRDFRNRNNYYHQVAGLSGPLGLIPDIHPEFDKSGTHHMEYSIIYQKFLDQCEQSQILITGHDETQVQVCDDKSQIDAFLNHIVSGRQSQAESLLLTNPALAMQSGQIIDLSGRVFEDITGMQYSLWALDWNMWTMIAKYLPDAFVLYEQIKHIPTKKWAQLYGETFSSQTLVHAYQIVIDAWGGKLGSEISDLFIAQVGRAQLLTPSHAIQEQYQRKRAFLPSAEFDAPAYLVRQENLLVKIKHRSGHVALHSLCTPGSIGCRGDKAKQHLEETRDAFISLFDVRSKQRTSFINQINQKMEINPFLRHIVAGEEKQAEQMLFTNKLLAIWKGDVTDHAGRIFKQVTAFQYCFWSLDMQMCNMLLRFMDLVSVRQQIQELVTDEEKKRPEWQGKNGDSALLVWDKLISCYSSLWSRKWTIMEGEDVNKFWVTEIGSLQLQLPIHVLQEYSSNFRLTSETRGSVTDLIGLGKEYALLRLKDDGKFKMHSVTKIYGSGFSNEMQADLDALKSLLKKRQEERLHFENLFAGTKSPEEMLVLAESLWKQNDKNRDRQSFLLFQELFDKKECKKSLIPYRLGCAFYHGRGTDKDLGVAYQYFDACKHTDRYSLYYLGLISTNDEFPKKDIDQGLDYLTQAHEKGVKEALPLIQKIKA